jgi:hypothetical protein
MAREQDLSFISGYPGKNRYPRTAKNQYNVHRHNSHYYQHSLHCLSDYSAGDTGCGYPHERRRRLGGADQRYPHRTDLFAKPDEGICRRRKIIG